jgi:hypothetical protein
VNVHVLARLNVFHGGADAVSVFDYLRSLSDGTDCEFVAERDGILELECLALPVHFDVNAPAFGSVLRYQSGDIVFGVNHENFFTQNCLLFEK